MTPIIVDLILVTADLIFLLFLRKIEVIYLCKFCLFRYKFDFKEENDPNDAKAKATKETSTQKPKVAVHLQVFYPFCELIICLYLIFITFIWFDIVSF